MKHTPTIFDKIISKETAGNIVYEDDLCLAFRDANPQAPVHILLIPKLQIATMNDLRPEHQQLLGHLLLQAAEIAKKEGVAESGYRLVFNTNGDAGQSVSHIHLHILGGRELTWPPG